VVIFQLLVTRDKRYKGLGRAASPISVYPFGSVPLALQRMPYFSHICCIFSVP